MKWVLKGNSLTWNQFGMLDNFVQEWSEVEVFLNFFEGQMIGSV